MKKILLVVIAATLFSTAFSQSDTWGVKFSDAILNRYKPTIEALSGKGWEYSNSIVLHGMEKIYHHLPDSTKYLNYIKAYVDANVNSSGTITASGGMGNTLDKVQPGVLCLFLYEVTGQIKYKNAATNMRNNLLTGSTFNKTPEGGFWHKQNLQYNQVMMVDGIYMAEPFLAKYGVMFNDDSALNTATRQTLLIASHTYDSVLHLAKHAWHYNKTKTWADPVTGTSKEVWSRGMGWYMMAIVDILRYLPSTHKDYKNMRALLDSLAIGIKNTQDPATGLWYQVMPKGDSAGNYLESSGSGMLIYSLKTAVDSGWIDKGYLDVAKKGWEGLKTKISNYTDGLPRINSFAPAMSVQDNYTVYVSPPYTPVNCPATPPAVQHPHGYCGILMAASAMEFPLYKLITNAANGNIKVTPSANSYLNGSTVYVTAVPDPGYTFVSWSGDITGTDTSNVVIMSSNKSITANFSAITTDFTFTGSGNWDDPANWKNNKIPPAILPAGSNIIIDPFPEGDCILNIIQHISNGATFTVNAGKKLVINGDLIIQ